MDSNGNYVYPTGPGGQAPYDDEGNLMPGFSYDENNNPVWVSSDYIEPDSPYVPDTGGDSYDYGYTNPDDSAYQDWWNTESYD
jgi:hypothetical protein